MDIATSSVTQTTCPSEEDDEWDTDGFVIPNLEIEKKKVDDSHVQSSSPKIKAEEPIYLGPPSQLRQDVNISSRKQRFKQMLKEADNKMNVSSGRENKVDNLRELVGGDGSGLEKETKVAKSVSRDWLDPHCHESEFERRQHI